MKIRNGKVPSLNVDTFCFADANHAAVYITKAILYISAG
jgi:hypothetical protein